MENNFEALLEMAIAEDLNVLGDITSDSIFGDQRGEAIIVSRQTAWVAGIDYARRAFIRIDPALDISLLVTDGQQIAAGQSIMSISGLVRSMLRAERIALNFLAYLSGIATETRTHVNIARIAGSTLILDTRKTLPGYRLLAKEAVRHGGGTNHRLGLYDMIMIKDNHIDAAGGIKPAIEKVRSIHGKRFRIEVECRQLSEVRQALELAVDVIMLDNMDEESCKQAFAIRNSDFKDSRTQFEASGDMNPEKLSRFAGIGMDFISIGRLTHSVMAVNFSMQIKQ